MLENLLLKDIEKVEGLLAYQFNNKKLLSLAFTHRSFVNENKHLTSEHNERLEFLGDAILELLISDFLFRNKPMYKEGDLSALRSRLVDASSCCLYVTHLKIGSYLLLGKGEMMNEGRGRDSIYSDLFEAILGAIYLDGGLEKAKQFFFSHFDALLQDLISEPSKNWKAMLQDFLQKKYQKQPIYMVLSEKGPDHEKTFIIAVFLDDLELGRGEGLSKKQAEQMAAKEAFEKLTS